MTILCLIFQPSTKLKSIDPLLHMALNKFGDEIMRGERDIKLRSPPTPSMPLNKTMVKTAPQVVFSTSFDHEFYTALTTSKHDFRLFFLWSNNLFYVLLVMIF
jgi:hypothetical protein